MKNIKKYFLIAVVIISFLSLRLYHLEESLTVGSDQGMHLLKIYELFQQRKISLIGPVSSFTVYGRQFFFGPATYYLPMPVFTFSGWNIFSVSYFTISVQLATLLILYQSLRKLFPKTKIAEYYALIFTFSPTMINYSRFLWNPNLMIPNSILLLSVLLILKKAKRRQNLLIGVIGFLLGLGMQFHYSYFLIIIFTFIWLYLGKKINLSNFFSLIIGFIIGFAPIILFELRHNFYNLTTFSQFVLASLERNNNSTIYTPGYIPEYYNFSFLPFLYLFASILLVKLERIRRVIPVFLISIFIIFSLCYVLPVPSNGFLSAQDWNYHGLNKVKEIIITENRPKYNVIDLLTGDVRAMYLRALLTFAGKTPESVDGYPDSKFLFIYSKVPIDHLLAGSLWEMDVIRPLVHKKTWYIQNGIYLYLLESKQV